MGPKDPYRSPVLNSFKGLVRKSLWYGKTKEQSTARKFNILHHNDIKQKKKSDALVGCVNTFIILHTIEGTFKVRNLYEKTLKIYKFQNYEHVVLFLNSKLLNLLNKTEQNSDFPLWDPKSRFGFQVLLKKFHPRINLTSLFFTKSYLLNTINIFSGHSKIVLWQNL
jgi:hypothetical protein